jgi:hypothetical protein
MKKHLIFLLMWVCLSSHAQDGTEIKRPPQIVDVYYETLLVKNVFYLKPLTLESIFTRIEDLFGLDSLHPILQQFENDPDGLRKKANNLYYTNSNINKEKSFVIYRLIGTKYQIKNKTLTFGVSMSYPYWFYYNNEIYALSYENKFIPLYGDQYRNIYLYKRIGNNVWEKVTQYKKDDGSWKKCTQDRIQNDFFEKDKNLLHAMQVNDGVTRVLLKSHTPHLKSDIIYMLIQNVIKENQNTVLWDNCYAKVLILIPIGDGFIFEVRDLGKTGRYREHNFWREDNPSTNPNYNPSTNTLNFITLGGKIEKIPIYY